MSEHTPGEWRAEKYYDGFRDMPAGWNIVADGVDVASACEFPYHCIDNEADARLIAAAPELLAALREARGYVAEYERGSKVHRDMVKKIDAAIAKAEGK